MFYVFGAAEHNCLRIALHFDFREGCVEHDQAKGLPRSGKRPTPQVIFSNKKNFSLYLRVAIILMGINFSGFSRTNFWRF